MPDPSVAKFVGLGSLHVMVLPAWSHAPSTWIAEEVTTGRGWSRFRVTVYVPTLIAEPFTSVSTLSHVRVIPHWMLGPTVLATGGQGVGPTCVRVIVRFVGVDGFTVVVAVPVKAAVPMGGRKSLCEV